MLPKRVRKYHIQLLLLGMLMAISGCQKQTQTIVYTVPKEPYTTYEDILKKKEPRYTWKTPKSWTPLSATGFRKAAFQINGTKKASAMMTISTLSGKSGSLHANINRWRKQIGLKPLRKTRLQKMILTKRYNKIDYKIIDIRYAKNKRGRKRTVVAITETPDNKTWFFKLTGDHYLVGRHKSAFYTLLKHAKL